MIPKLAKLADLSDEEIPNLVTHMVRLGAIPDGDEIAPLVIPQEKDALEQKLDTLNEDLASNRRVFTQPLASGYSAVFEHHFHARELDRP